MKAEIGIVQSAVELVVLDDDRHPVVDGRNAGIGGGGEFCFHGASSYFAVAAEATAGFIASVMTDTSNTSLTSSSLEMIFSSNKNVAR